MRSIFILVAIAVSALCVFSQPRQIPKEEKPANTVSPAPPSFPARYEGGIFGYKDKESGTLKFDDINRRLTFFGSDQKEWFGLPYDSLLIVYSDEKSVTSSTGNVISAIPLPGSGLGKLIKEKRVYLVIQYDDPDVDSKGTTSFKLENKDLLESVMYALGAKANLRQRGEAFIRPRNTSPQVSN